MNLGAFFRLIRRKMVRDPLPPEDVAAGWALGMFVGCSVPFGLQLIVSVPLAMMMRVSKVGATVETLRAMSDLERSPEVPASTQGGPMPLHRLERNPKKPLATLIKA